MEHQQHGAMPGTTAPKNNPVRTVTNEGAVPYHASRWGMVRALPDLEAVAAFARMVGGAPHV